MFDFDVRVCPLCSTFFVSRDPLCESCRDLVIFNINENQRAVQLTDRHRVYHLLRWTKTNAHLASSLIYSIKTGRNRGLLDWLAGRFFLKHFESLNRSRRTQRLLVPIPGAQRVDHASVWAKSLAEILGSGTWSPTWRPHLLQESQKTKGLTDRRSVVHLKRPNRVGRSRQLHRNYDLVVCDDVYTTGSTAQATMKHLQGATKDVFCIAYRERDTPERY